MQKPLKADRLSFRKLGEEYFIIDTHGKKLAHNLNEVGSFIWERCDGHHTVEEIAQELTDVFAINFESALLDTNEFIEKLSALGLVK